MSILLAAIWLSAVLIIAPIAVLKNALGAGGLASLLAIIGILLCLPLGYGWFSVIFGSDTGDGWYELIMILAGLASALLGTLASLFASFIARQK